MTVEMESLLCTHEEMLWGDYAHKDNVTSCHMRSFEDNEYLSTFQRFLFGLESSARDWTEQSLAAMHPVFIRLEMLGTLYSLCIKLCPMEWTHM